MDTISSSEFRKRFAHLRTLTVVTVNGHTIGYWHPGIPPNDAVDVGGVPETRPIGMRPIDEHPRVRNLVTAAMTEFRPAPKVRGSK
jgi:hypothetical protein